MHNARMESIYFLIIERKLWVIYLFFYEMYLWDILLHARIDCDGDKNKYKNVWTHEKVEIIECNTVD